jgi:membrane protease YdiL (CAAX protease family)
VPPPPRAERLPRLWIAPAAVLLGLAGAVFSTLLIEIVGGAFGSPLSHPTAAVNLTADYFFDFSFVGSALWFAVLQAGMRPVDFGYRRIAWKRGVAAFVIAGLGYYAITFIYSALVSLHEADKLPSELGTANSTAAAIAAAVFVCAVAPMAEEFFFRGFLFGVLRRLPIAVAGRRLGPWVAAVLVGLLFGFAHLGSAPAEDLVPLGFLGFVLCLVRWRTGSLYPCMALHSVNNCLALGVSQFHWGSGPILLLTVGSLLAIAAVTGPLSRSPAGPMAGAGAA